MILHVVPDSAFLSQTIRQLRSLPGIHRYVCFTEPHHSSCVFKPIKHERESIEFVPVSEYNQLLERCRSIDHGRVVVVFHCITMVNMSVIEAWSGKIPLCWVPWGCDIYDLPLSGMLPKTFGCEILRCGWHKKLSLLKHALCTGLLYQLFPKFSRGIRIRSKFSECFALIPADYAWYRDNYGSKLFPAKQGRFYYADDSTVAPQEKMSAVEDRQNVFVGNCSIPKYNHREVIDLLCRNCDLNGRKVYAPLSYGDTNYAKAIANYGAQRLHDRFIAVRKFMPLQEYNRIFDSCGVYIANHLSQGGLGTIELAFISGCKVFLNKRNPIYDYYISLGAVVFPFEESVVKRNDFATGLSDEEQKKNRAICLRLRGVDEMKKIYSQFVHDCEELADSFYGPIALKGNLK